MMSCLFVLCTYGLGLCPFIGLVCDLLLRGGRGLSPECTLPEECLGHDLSEPCVEDTGAVWCLTYLVARGGATFHRAPRSLVISETWSMGPVSPKMHPAHKHCELLLPQQVAHERARGKRRGFSPGAAARHSQSARVTTDFLGPVGKIRIEPLRGGRKRKKRGEREREQNSTNLADCEWRVAPAGLKPLRLPRHRPGQFHGPYVMNRVLSTRLTQ